MMTGRDNLQLINEHFARARQEYEEAGVRLAELHRQLDALARETGGCYRDLARLRLDTLQADRLASRLDELDQAMVMQLEKLNQARNELQERIAAGMARQQQLEEHRKDLERQRDEAAEEMQRRREQAGKEFQESEEYRFRRERVKEAEAVAGYAQEKASRTEEDKLVKSKPYEADSLFMYLWNRRYLTPDYQAGRLTRQLDEWVANLIDFRNNRANYHMLQELPVRLREHAAKAQQTARSEAQALAAMERQASESEAVLALQTQVGDVERRIEELHAEMEAEDARYRQYRQEQSGFHEATHPLSKEVLDMQMVALQREDLTDLSRKARATPRPEDDALVARLHQIQQRRAEIEMEIQSVNRFLQQRDREMTELEESRRRYGLR